MLETRMIKIISTSGDCCFTLYSEPKAGGYQQSLEFEGEYKIDLTSVQSVYVGECYR